jgi:uncharacterized protein (TIRG00374 family)
MVKRIAGLIVCGLVLYGVAPAVLDVLDAWPQVIDIEPYWFVAMVAAQLGSWAGLWLLQRLAVDAHSWWPVVTSNLASGALGRVVPGGAAAAGAMQFRMLVQAGVPASLAGLGIGVAGIVVLAALTALPVLALPPILLGLAVPEKLSHAAFGGVALFLALIGVGALLMSGDRPVLWVGRVTQRIGRRVRRHKPPAEDLPERFRAQRNLVRRAFGSRWWEAVAGAAARWVLDYVTLLTALAAVGQHPRPSLVLLAFCAAQLLAQIPITPGGLGVVEAGLTGTLALIGVPAGAAAVATLAYRLVSYWLALPLGGAAWLWHRRKVRAGAISVPRPARAG